jgi:hypothetical protein
MRFDEKKRKNSIIHVPQNIHFYINNKKELQRAKTGWIGIGIICQSGATCLNADCWFSEYQQQKRAANVNHFL